MMNLVQDLEILERTNEGIMLVNAQGVIVYWNRGAEKIFGYSKKEALGKKFWDLVIPPEAREREMKFTEEFFKTAESELSEKIKEGVAVRKNGKEKFVELSVYPMFKNDERYAIAIIRDITKRKTIEENLKKAIKYKNKILNGLTYPVVVIDREYTIVDVNKRTLEFFMKKKGELVGKKCYEAFHSLDSPPDYCPLKKLFAPPGKIKRAFGEIEFEKIGKVALVNASVLEKGKSGFESALCSIVDITERKKYEEILKVIHRLTISVYSTRDFVEFMDKFRIEINAFFKTKNFFVALKNGKEDSYTLPYFFGEKSQAEVVDEENGLIKKALRGQSPMLLTTADLKAYIKKGILKKSNLPPKIWLGIPLKLGKRFIGTLVLQDYKTERALTRKDLELLGLISDEIAALIDAKQAIERNKRAEIRLRDALTKSIEALSLAIEKRDPYTAGHQKRVSELSVAIAKEMGLPKEQIEGLRLGALIHDIGKIQIPLEILSKPGKLNELEYQIIKTHPRAGYEIIKHIDFPWPIAEMILQHHERMDGSGYPMGLKNGEIILEARIIAVADVVEAMSSHRPYRSALGIEAALQEIEKNKGKLYDPQVVDACIKVFKKKGFKFPL